MTPEAAFDKWMNGFGIPAYASTSTPDEGDAEWRGFPYLTYDLVVGEWGSGEVNVAVNLWDRTDSEAGPNAKVREIGRAIGRGGTLVACDGGTLWLKKGSPWAQTIRASDVDGKIKRRYLNVIIDYMTTD